MAHPKNESELIPIDTVCLWQRDKSKPAIRVLIKKHVYLYSQFLHYEGTREDKDGTFAFYHDDLNPIESTDKQ